MALDLTTTLAGVLFMDHAGQGAYGNHRRALGWAAAQHERVTIVEDDAIPVYHVDRLASEWAAAYPDDLISFYLGTGHPRQWQARIDQTWDDEPDTVHLPQLIHGVAYSIPTNMVRDILDTMRPGPVDYAIGDAWRHLTDRPVVYPKGSLFDHRDEDSIVQGHSNRAPRGVRKARALAR